MQQYQFILGHKIQANSPLNHEFPSLHIAKLIYLEFLRTYTVILPSFSIYVIMDI